MTNLPAPGLVTTGESQPSGRRADVRSQFVVSRYQIALVAVDIDDLISSVGGWLFDRIACGWAVNSIKFLDDGCGGVDDLRPLMILGYRPPRPELGDLPPQRNCAPSQTMAVSGAAIEKGSRLCRQLRRALRDESTDVLVWGTTPAGLYDQGLQEMKYCLSPAASRFKAEAMRAASLSIDDLSEVEYTYRSPAPLLGSQIF